MLLLIIFKDKNKNFISKLQTYSELSLLFKDLFRLMGFAFLKMKGKQNTYLRQLNKNAPNFFFKNEKI